MSYNDYFIYDKLLNDKYVICGVCALSRNALTTASGIPLHLFTRFRRLDNLNIVALTYHYNPSIDYTNFVTPMETNEGLLLPNSERAIIESIKFNGLVPEDILIESISNYFLFGGTLEKLYDMADFYNLDREVLDYWYNEMLEDTEV